MGTLQPRYADWKGRPRGVFLFLPCVQFLCFASPRGKSQMTRHRYQTLLCFLNSPCSLGSRALLLATAGNCFLQNVVENLAFLLKEHGLVPNGARTYYLNRRSPSPSRGAHPCAQSKVTGPIPSLPPPPLPQIFAGLFPGEGGGVSSLDKWHAHVLPRPHA